MTLSRARPLTLAPTPSPTSQKSSQTLEPVALQAKVALADGEGAAAAAVAAVVAAEVEKVATRAARRGKTTTSQSLRKKEMRKLPRNWQRKSR